MAEDSSLDDLLALRHALMIEQRGIIREAADALGVQASVVSLRLRGIKGVTDHLPAILADLVGRAGADGLKEAVLFARIK